MVGVWEGDGGKRSCLWVSRSVDRGDIILWGGFGLYYLTIFFVRVSFKLFCFLIIIYIMLFVESVYLFLFFVKVYLYCYL